MKRIILSLSLALILCLPVVTFAAFGIEETAGGAGLSTDASQTVPAIAGNVIGTALSIIGVLFFILMVYGGFNWMIARGDDTLITKAKDTITAAIVGLIIVLGSFAITNFAFQSAEGDSPDNRADCRAKCQRTVQNDPAGLQACQAACNAQFAN